MKKSSGKSNHQDKQWAYLHPLSSTITTKGQATIPIAIRKRLGLKPGDQIGFVEQNGQICLTPFNKSLSSLKGFLRRPKRTLSLDEMNKIVEEGYAGS